MKESLEDQFRTLVGGYYGVEMMDEYPLKVYILKEIENYIQDFLIQNPILHFDYQQEAEKVKEKVLPKTKLQDSLTVLFKINAPMELIWLIKKELAKRSRK